MVATLAITATWNAAHGEPGRKLASTQLTRSTFDRTLDAVLSRYYEPVDETKLLSAGLRAILAELDPHTHFVSAAQRKALRERASGGTTGMAVALRVDGE
ncbi:MAG: hypothetical protein IAG13_01760, partial [Deltaproteobacteria bacterium]|nr:hypothetical protein [Nannocystaceae bacterium]